MQANMLNELVDACRAPVVPAEARRRLKEHGITPDHLTVMHGSVQEWLAKLTQYMDLKELLPSFEETAARVASLNQRLADLNREFDTIRIEIAALQPAAQEAELVQARIAGLGQLIRVKAAGDELIGLATLPERKAAGLLNRWDRPEQN